MVMISSRSTNSVASRKSEIFFIVAAAALIFRNCFLRPFAVADDYRMLLAVPDMGIFDIYSGHAGVETATGRVIPALLFKAIWFKASNLQSLDYVRFVGLVIVVICVLLLMNFFRSLLEIQNLSNRFLLAAGGLIVLCLPSTAAILTWAQKTTQILALLFAVLAGLLATRTSSSNRYILPLVAVLLMMSAFTYQHFVMIATLPIFVSLAQHYGTSLQKLVFRRAFFVFSAGLIALIFNFLFVSILYPDVAERIAGQTIFDRLESFFLSCLPKSMHLFVRQDIPLVLFSLLLMSLIIGVSIALSHTSIRLLIAVFASAGVSALITLGGDGNTAYRIVFPSQMTLWTGVIGVAAISIQNSSNNQLKKLMLSLVLVTVVIVGVEANTTINQRIILANERDYAELECKLQRHSALTPPKEIVIRLSPVPLRGSNAVYSEIGLLARHVNWLAADQLQLAIRELNLQNLLGSVPIRILDSQESLPAADESILILDSQESCSG